MSQAVVGVVFPVGDHDPCLGECPEYVDVEAFVADAAVEGFDVAVAPWLAGWDERQADVFADPAGHRVLVGSDDEILTAIRQRQQRWGINRLVIREDAIDKLAPLLPRLHETTE